MPLALLFLGLAAYSARDVFGQVLAQARPAPLILTVIAWSMLSLLTPMITWVILRGLGVGISYRTTLRIHVDRLPARYLPGGVWQTVSRVVDLHGLGVDRPRLTVLVMIENLAPLATALIAAGTCVLLAGNSKLPAPAILGTGLSLAAGLAWLIRRMFRQVTLQLPAYLIALAITLLFWLFAATTFVIYWSAFPFLHLDGELLNLYATYLLAWVVGFVAVFAPQGIGVFEVVASLQLRADIPLAGMTVLVAGFRAAMLSGDGLAYLLGRILRWTVHHQHEKL